MLAFRDPDLEARFDREGYVVCRVLDDAQVEAAKAMVAQWTSQSLETSVTAMPEGLLGGFFFSHTDAPAAGGTSIAERVEAILAPAVAKFLVGQGDTQEPGFILKHRGSARLDLHLHSPRAADPFERYIMCWCSLVDCGEASGALTVIPRSHRLHRHIQLPGEQRYFMDYLEHLEQRHTIAVPLRAGEAIFFDNLILHGSRPNTGPVPRQTLVAGWLREGISPVGYRRGADGTIEAIDDITAKHDQYAQRTASGLSEAATVVRRYPAWDQPLTLAQFETLLASDLRPSEAFDPYLDLFGSAPIADNRQVRRTGLWPRARQILDRAKLALRS